MSADGLGLSDRARSIWGKTNRVDDSEWLPLYVHMADSAAVATKIWDTWVPQGTKDVIARDLGGDEKLARKLAVFLAGVHDIGKATPVFQAKPITFGAEAESFAWKAEKAGLPMIAGLRDCNHPTHPIAGEAILEGYLMRVHGWDRKTARQYACVVGGHHGTPPGKSKVEDAGLEKRRSGLDSTEWVAAQDELIDFIAEFLISMWTIFRYPHATNHHLERYRRFQYLNVFRESLSLSTLPCRRSTPFQPSLIP